MLCYLLLLKFLTIFAQELFEQKQIRIVVDSNLKTHETQSP